MLAGKSRNHKHFSLHILTICFIIRPAGKRFSSLTVLMIERITDKAAVNVSSISSVILCTYHVTRHQLFIGTNACINLARHGVHCEFFLISCLDSDIDDHYVCW